MGILTDAVLSSIIQCGRGLFYFDNLDNQELKMLKSITKRQRHKFKKLGIVPEQVLQIAYGFGWLPGEGPPKGGMEVKRLLTWLRKGPYRDDENKELSLWFCDKIIEEWKPKCPPPKNKNKRRGPH